jgi:pyruvate carboxylase
MEVVLGDTPPVLGRPGESLPPVDVEAARIKASEHLDGEASDAEVASFLLYPKVFTDFAKHGRQFGEVSRIPTPNFFYGQKPGDEIAVDIEPGKRLIIKYLATGSPYPDGSRTVFFELNGQPREINVIDKSLEPEGKAVVKADPDDPTQVGASMPGMVINVAVSEGERVRAGQKLVVLEAMKMETTINAPIDGVIGKVAVQPGTQVAGGDLLMTLVIGGSAADRE